jgi:hypothetical protein
MSKKVKIALAIGLQLALIGAVGDFVGWPYIEPILITSGIAFGMAIIFFLIEMSKE